MSRTTIPTKTETKKRVFKMRGKMESKDGKRRTLDDVLNELMDYYEGKT